MSLSSLNSPPLVTGLLAQSVVYYLLSPKPLQFAATAPLSTLRGINLAAYVLQVVAVSQPGRIDDQVAAKMSSDATKKNDDDDAAAKTKNKKDNNDDMANALLPSSGQTLVAPAGWAFAIWAPIFLGEAAFVVAQWFVEEGSPLATYVRNVSVPFSFAHLFQTLWCAAFRPKYQGHRMYVSVGALGATAWSLSRAHGVLYAYSFQESLSQYLLYGLPLSLHFGWTMAATLVNLNGAVVATTTTTATTRSVAVVVVGHATVVTATAFGVYLSCVARPGSPVVVGVLSWALFAVAGGMAQRIKQLRLGSSSSSDMMILDAIRQERLSRVGAWITAGASVFATVQSWSTK